MSGKWCELGSAEVRSGVLYVRCKGGAIDEDGTAPDFGEVPMMCALGVTAMPYPPTKEGAAEAVVDESVAGFSGIASAARDTRSAKIVGGLKPGDTVLHSTGPQEAAQVQLKEEKRIAAILTKSSGGKTMAVIIDGTNDKLQITAMGAMFQIDNSGNVAVASKGGAALLLQDDQVHFGGTVNLGSGNPPGFTLMASPIPSPGGIASVPLFQVLGVAIGFVAWTLCTLFGIPFRMIWCPGREEFAAR